MSLKKQGSSYTRDKLETISEDYSYYELLGILNSKICLKLLNEIRGEHNKDINPNYLRDIPIPIKTNENAPIFQKVANRVVSLLKLKSKPVSEMQDHEKINISGMIDHNIESIEKLVEALYQQK